MFTHRPKKGSVVIAAGIAAWAGHAAAAELTVGDERLPAFERLENDLRAEFEPLPLTEANNVEGSLINGTPVNPQEFPAVLRMTTGGTCTAALVGPAVMLLAAHCVEDRERIIFVTGTRRVAGICEHAPAYHPIANPGDDWALCLMEFVLGGIPFERVEDETVPALGDQLVLTGYGCVRRNEPLDGLLRIGISNVVAKPVARWPDEPSTIYTVSDLSAGEAVLCPGDSGGPLFRTGADLSGARTIVGVNSRTTFEHGFSLFSATASEAGRAFLHDWTERHAQSICGVNLDIGCK